MGEYRGMGKGHKNHIFSEFFERKRGQTCFVWTWRAKPKGGRKLQRKAVKVIIWKTFSQLELFAFPVHGGRHFSEIKRR